MTSAHIRKLPVHVIPNARHNMIREESGGLKVRLTAPAVDGKANKALILLLAQHCHVRKSRIRIVRGHTARHKLIEIEDERKGHAERQNK